MQHSKIQPVTESEKANQNPATAATAWSSPSPSPANRALGEVFVRATPGAVSLFNPAQNCLNSKGGHFLQVNKLNQLT